MDNARWVQGHEAFFDVVARHEITIYVVQYLIRIDVAVVVGRGNGVWVIVIEARHEGADHEVVGLKGLVNGGRHVNATSQWLEVIRAEDVREVVSIPADHVKWVAAVSNVMQDTILFHFDQEIAEFIMCLQVLRKAQVALAEWRVLQELANLVHVVLGESNRREALCDEEAVVLTVEVHLVNESARDDDVIVWLELELTQ